jgi:hypothetical protein
MGRTNLLVRVAALGVVLAAAFGASGTAPAGAIGEPAVEVGSCWGRSSLTITAVLADGTPASGVQFDVTGANGCGYEPLVTDAEGRAVFRGLVDGLVTVASRTTGVVLPGVGARRAVVQGRSAATVTVRRTQELSGTLLQLDGRPATAGMLGSKVRVLASSAEGVTASATIASDGTWIIRDAPSGQVTLSLIAGGLAYYRAVPTVVSVAPGQVVTGIPVTVTRDQGQFYLTLSPGTSAGSHLQFEPLSGGAPIVVPVPPATGAFWTPPLPTGEYRIRVDGSAVGAPTWAPSSTSAAGGTVYTLLTGAARSVTVTMRPGVDPSVRAVRLLTRDGAGLPTNGVTLEVWSHVPGGQARGAVTAADGSVTLSLRPGRYTVHALPTSRTAPSTTVVTVPAGTGPYEAPAIAVPRLPVLGGTVTGPGGAPVASAVVTSAIASVSTRADGTYQVVVPEGAAPVLVRPPAGSALGATAVLHDGRLDTAATADVAMGAGGWVSVPAAGFGSPCLGLALEPVGSVIGRVASACVVDGATAVVGPVAPGTYVLRLGASHFHPGTADRAGATIVTVEAGSTTALAPVVMGGRGAVEVTARLDGAPAPGVRVQVRRASDGTRLAAGSTSISAATGTALLNLPYLPLGVPLVVEIDSVLGNVEPWSTAVTVPVGTVRLTADLVRATPPPLPPLPDEPPDGGGSGDPGEPLPGGPEPSTGGGSGPTVDTQVAGRTLSRPGYRLVDAAGAVYGFGGASVLGAARPGVGAVVVDIEPTPSGDGYWTVDTGGDVQAFGDAMDLGDPDRSAMVRGESVTSVSRTPSGRGLWAFTSRGRVLTLGDARFLGDMSAVALQGPVLDSVATPSGNGYYMVASDGGVFAFGDAEFSGSMGGRPLNAPVQSLVPDPDGDGYWLVASDGGVFAFDAPFRGSMGGRPLNQPMTGMVPYGTGYLMVAEDGGVFVFSDLPFSGSLGDTPPAAKVTSIAATS